MIINANNGEIVVEGKNNIITNITWTSEERLSELLDYLIRPPAMGGTYHPKPESITAGQIRIRRLSGRLTEYLRNRT